MNFFTRYGGISTHTPWNRPDKDTIKQWRDKLSFDLNDWWVVGNVIEEFSPSWDTDIILYQTPLKTSLNDLSDMFSEMIQKGFEHKLLIDCAYVSEWYDKEWKPFYKIRPDKEFYKELKGSIYNPQYKADEVEQLGEHLYKFTFNKPYHNWYKGIERGYNFTGISLNKF